MAKCIRCGTETMTSSKIYISCLDKWCDMRNLVFTTLSKKYGKLTRENHPLFVTETKRLEKIWRKNKENFNLEIKKINNDKNI